MTIIKYIDIDEQITQFNLSAANAQQDWYAAVVNYNNYLALYGACFGIEQFTFEVQRLEQEYWAVVKNFHDYVCGFLHAITVNPIMDRNDKVDTYIAYALHILPLIDRVTLNIADKDFIPLFQSLAAATEYNSGHYKTFATLMMRLQQIGFFSQWVGIGVRLPGDLYFGAVAKRYSASKDQTLNKLGSILSVLVGPAVLAPRIAEAKIMPTVLPVPEAAPIEPEVEIEEQVAELPEPATPVAILQPPVPEVDYVAIVAGYSIDEVCQTLGKNNLSTQVRNLCLNRILELPVDDYQRLVISNKLTISNNKIGRTYVDKFKTKGKEVATYVADVVFGEFIATEASLTPERILLYGNCTNKHAQTLLHIWAEHHSTSAVAEAIWDKLKSTTTAQELVGKKYLDINILEILLQQRDENAAAAGLKKLFELFANDYEILNDPSVHNYFATIYKKPVRWLAVSDLLFNLIAISLRRRLEEMPKSAKALALINLASILGYERLKQSTTIQKLWFMIDYARFMLEFRRLEDLHKFKRMVQPVRCEELYCSVVASLLSEPDDVQEELLGSQDLASIANQVSFEQHLVWQRLLRHDCDQSLPNSLAMLANKYCDKQDKAGNDLLDYAIKLDSLPILMILSDECEFVVSERTISSAIECAKLSDTTFAHLLSVHRGKAVNLENFMRLLSNHDYVKASIMFEFGLDPFLVVSEKIKLKYIPSTPYKNVNLLQFMILCAIHGVIGMHVIDVSRHILQATKHPKRVLGYKEANGLTVLGIIAHSMISNDDRTKNAVRTLVELFVANGANIFDFSIREKFIGTAANNVLEYVTFQLDDLELFAFVVNYLHSHHPEKLAEMVYAPLNGGELIQILLIHSHDKKSDKSTYKYKEKYAILLSLGYEFIAKDGVLKSAFKARDEEKVLAILRHKDFNVKMLDNNKQSVWHYWAEHFPSMRILHELWTVTERIAIGWKKAKYAVLADDEDVNGDTFFHLLLRNHDQATLLPLFEVIFNFYDRKVIFLSLFHVRSLFDMLESKRPIPVSLIEMISAVKLRTLECLKRDEKSLLNHLVSGKQLFSKSRIDAAIEQQDFTSLLLIMLMRQRIKRHIIKMFSPLGGGSQSQTDALVNANVLAYFYTQDYSQTYNDKAVIEHIFEHLRANSDQNLNQLAVCYFFCVRNYLFLHVLLKQIPMNIYFIDQENRNILQMLLISLNEFHNGRELIVLAKEIIELLLADPKHQRELLENRDSSGKTCSDILNTMDHKPLADELRDFIKLKAPSAFIANSASNVSPRLLTI